MPTSILCLPQSLPEDSALQRALAEALQARERLRPAAAFTQLATILTEASRQSLSGTWGEALRQAAGHPEQDVLIWPLHDPPMASEVRMLAAAEPLSFSAGLHDLVAAAAPPVLDATESQALAEAADRHLAEEGVRVRWLTPRLWRLELRTGIEVRTEPASLIAGRELRDLMPQGPDARRVERWMNELQMLLHAHPVNAARSARGEAPVNAVWLSGFVSVGHTQPQVEIEGRLAEALSQADLEGWVNAWKDLSERCATVETVILGGQAPHVLLRPAAPGSKSWLAGFAARLRGRPRLASAWSALLPAA